MEWSDPGQIEQVNSWAHTAFPLTGDNHSSMFSTASHNFPLQYVNGPWDSMSLGQNVSETDDRVKNYWRDADKQ